MKRREAILAFVAVASLATLVAPSTAKKATEKPKERGEQVYAQYCASCHAGGGNTVKPSRPVAGSKELATIGKFRGYLSAPPGHMPYYQNLVKDQATLNALFNYCKTLKKPVRQASMVELH